MGNKLDAASATNGNEAKADDGPCCCCCCCCCIRCCMSFRRSWYGSMCGNVGVGAPGPGPPLLPPEECGAGRGDTNRNDPVLPTLSKDGKRSRWLWWCWCTVPEPGSRDGPTRRCSGCGIISVTGGTDAPSRGDAGCGGLCGCCDDDWGGWCCWCWYGFWCWWCCWLSRKTRLPSLRPLSPSCS